MTSEEKKKAIDALRISAPVMPMTQEEFNDYIQTLNKIMDLLEQEPDQLRVNGIDELISKREALASIKALYPNMMPVIDYFGARRKWAEKNKPYFECEKAIEQLQPVKQDKQESKIGHWILQSSNKDQGERDFIWWKCSECGQVIYSGAENDRREYHAFCGRCGAKMESEG